MNIFVDLWYYLGILRKPLLIATNNAHKVSEFKRLLGNLDYELLTPEDLGVKLDVVESGTTLEQNARLKAQAFANYTGILSLADDSGIEVDALNGRPGVYSARYGGPSLSDSDRVELLLNEMIGLPDSQRTCRYRVVLILAKLDGKESQTEGLCEGSVAYKPVGLNGFGYDPIFFVNEFRITIAEMSAAQKDLISHRVIATRKMAWLLQNEDLI